MQTSTSQEGQQQQLSAALHAKSSELQSLHQRLDYYIELVRQKEEEKAAIIA